MDNGAYRIFVSPLLPSADISDFVSRLDPSDVHARFGRLPESGCIASLLVPGHVGLCVLGAWSRGVLMGTAMISEAGNRRCELALLVRSDMKRRRVGTLLTFHAVALARESDADEMVAQTQADNVAALRLLQRAGFRSAGRLTLEREFTLNLKSPNTELACVGRRS